MATLAFAAIAAKSGFAAGTFIGFASSVAGAVVDNLLLFPALFRQDSPEGARLGDFAINQSFEGAPAAWVDGKARVSGVPIYLGEPIDNPSESGGGKAGPDSTTHTFRRDVVVAFARDAFPSGAVHRKVIINGDVVADPFGNVSVSSNTMSAVTVTKTPPIACTLTISIPAGAVATAAQALQLGSEVTVSGFAHAGNNFTTTEPPLNGFPYLLNVGILESGIANITFRIYDPGGVTNPWQNAAAGPTITLTQDPPDWPAEVVEDAEWFDGDPAQGPDTYIEAQVGTGNVPAYRGAVTLRMGMLNLTRYGNGIANYQAIIDGQGGFGVSTLEEHVAHILERAGLTPAEYDTAGMSGVHLGHAVTGPQSAREVLAKALLATDNIAAEYDGKLRIRWRPQTPDFVIAAEDIGAFAFGSPLSSALPFESADASEYEVPRAVSANYSDPAHDYVTRTKREIAPPPATADETSINLSNWTMSEADARAAAYRAVLSAITARQPKRFTLPLSYSAMQPGHLVTMPQHVGNPQNVLVTSRTRGTDGVLTFEGTPITPAGFVFLPPV